MIQTSTTKFNDVIQFVYDDSSCLNTDDVEKLLIENEQLLDFFIDCQWLKNEMSKISVEPSTTAINKIKSFAKAYQPMF